MSPDPGMFAPLGVSFEAITDIDFWISVGVAGITRSSASASRSTPGSPASSTSGAAGFMAIGAYSMAILVLDGVSFWVSLPLAMLITMLFGAIVGLLPAVAGRLLAVATIAMAEMVRLFAQNARDLTGGNQGLFCADDDPSELLHELVARCL